MSNRFGLKLYLVSWLVALFVGLALTEPAGAHGDKGSKFKVKDSQAKQSCSIEAPRFQLGLLVEDLSHDPAAAQVIEAGALVVRVIEGGPAAAAGIKPGDVIVAVGDQPIANAQQLSDLAANIQAGAEAQLSVINNGKRENKVVTLAEPQFANLKNMPGKSMPQLYPGMFMEEMMGRSPIGQIKEGALVPGQGFTPLVQEQIVIKQRIPNYVQLYLQHQATLGLNAEQVKQLEHLAREQQKHQIKVKADIEIAEIELQELLAEGEIELSKIEKKIAQLEAARGEKLLFQVKTLHQAKQLLTAEQQAQLKQMQLN